MRTPLSDSLSNMIDRFRLGALEAAETFFGVQQSFYIRLLVSLFVAFLSLCIIYTIHNLNGHYFPSITVAAAVAITLVSGFFSGISIALMLALAADYLFIPPIGAVLADRDATEHFLIIAFLAVSMSALVATFREMLRKAIITKREAERASALMEKILSTVSHDIRNSLSVPALAVDRMQHSYDKPERLRSLVATALDGLNRTDNMIQVLLDASHTGDGRPVSIKFEYCDLGDVVRKTCDDLNFVHANRFQFIRPEPIMGFWNSEGICRAVENLGLNAVKYGFNGRAITVTLRRDVDNVILSVHNEGKKIEEADRAKLFDRFFRTGSAQREDANGWGLGLTVVKEVAAAHGGSVAVESSEENGTIFRITAPIRAEPPAEGARCAA